MTDRRAGEGFSLPPQRIGGGAAGGRGGRGRGLKVAAVLAVATGIIGVASLGPRLSGRPNFDVSFFATPVPSTSPSPAPTPRPILPDPTPLPEITRTDGGALTGRVAVWADGLRVLDLGSGTIGSEVYTELGRDAVVPQPNGDGWWCICMADAGGGGIGGATREVQLVSIAADGTETGRRTVTTLGDLSDLSATEPLQTDVDIAPDGRSGLISVGRQRGTTFEYSIARLDLESGTLGPMVSVGTQAAPPLPTPSPTPNPEGSSSFTSAAGPYVRRSPDGSRAVVWSQVQQVVSDNVTFTETAGWLVPLDGAGQPEAPTAVPAFRKALEWCPTVGFVRSDLLVLGCFVFPADGGSDLPRLRLMKVGADGTVAGQLDIQASQTYFAEPLFDTANGLIWLWDPYSLTLVRVDTAELRTTSTTFDPLVERTGGVASFGGVRPVWSRAGSSVGTYGGSQIAGSPDGSRLYLVGFGREPRPGRDMPASLGVFVVDPASLALLDRWAPATNYAAIEPVLEGRALAVSGMPGADAGGGRAPWQASVTFHDAVDGRILLMFGQVGEGSPPIVLRR